MAELLGMPMWQRLNQFAHPRPATAFLELVVQAVALGSFCRMTKSEGALVRGCDGFLKDDEGLDAPDDVDSIFFEAHVLDM